MIKTVAIVDDHTLFREGLGAILSVQRDFRMAGQGSTSAEALHVVGRLRPTILLLDVELHDEPVRGTLCAVRRLAPEVRVFILTMYRDHALKAELIRLGAVDYIEKSVPSAELLRLLRMPRGPDLETAIQRGSKLLTSREVQVLNQMALAFSNQNIGARLNITEGTVKRHAHQIFSKLRVRSRMEAVETGVRLGLITRS